MLKFIVADETNAGRGEAYNRKQSIVVESFPTLTEAVEYVANTYTNTRHIVIEEWDEDEGMFIDSYTVTAAKKALKKSAA